MKIYCVYTPAHQVLFEEYFQPSIPPGFDLQSCCLEIPGRGDFLSEEFLRCIQEKIKLIIASLRDNQGEIIVWSDIDIQFFKTTPEDLLKHLGSFDIVFQREGHSSPDVNTGFFVCRCSEKTLGFFERVLKGLGENPGKNEQWVINSLLQSGGASLVWGYLPFRFYARTHGWPPPRDLALYHANFTVGQDGVGQKIRQFRDLALLRERPLVGFVWTSLKYGPRRLKRWLGIRQRCL